MLMSDHEPPEPQLTHWPEDTPDALLADTLDIRCMIAETLPELCDGWETTVENDPAEMRLDERDEIHFPDDVPTECGECGNRSLVYNNVELTFRR
jgi:hypothetical protein